MPDKIRVIIADDSALMRKKISDILSSDPEIEVVAVTRDGDEAVKSVYSLKPDVVTLDVEMPIMNGLDALGYIMSELPTPCVMISAFTDIGTKESIRALELGAVDFVTKPGGVISKDIDNVADEIINKVKIAAKVSVKKLKVLMPDKAREDQTLIKKPTLIKKVFLIASSTGGTQALATIIPALRSYLQAAILVVQHMPIGFTKSLSERLNWQSKIKVVEAENGMPIMPGCVIIAKAGLHMEVIGSPKEAHVILTDKPFLHGVRPAADLMMKTAAEVFKDMAVGIVLTGMGTDGTAGARAIKSEGGIVLAEDEDSCVVYGMSRSVIDSKLADKVVRLREVAEEMEKLLDDYTD